MNLPAKPQPKGVRKKALLKLAKLPQDKRDRLLRIEALRRGMEPPKKG